MKKILITVLQGILALMLIPFSFAASTHLTIATAEYPPYTSQFIVQKGYVNHIVSAAFKQKGIDVKFIFVPWARALQGTLDGAFDAVSYGYYREQRNQHFIHSQSLVKEKIFLFGLKNQTPKTWHSLNELLNFRFGMTRGYSYSDKFSVFTEIIKHQPSIVNTNLQNFKMLMLQRIDLFPMEEFSARHLLNQHFSKEQVSNIHMLLPMIEEVSTHLLISKINPKARQLVNMFNDGLSKLKTSGVLSTFEQQFNKGFYIKSLK